MKMTKSFQKSVRGCLQVVAIKDTQRGDSDDIIPEGTIGYVLGARYSDNQSLIKWHMKFPKGDWGVSSHHTADVKPTGERG